MTVTIVGSQLGDEGKGGIVDRFSDRADVVVRYQGGDNAGHTVVHDGTEFKLSLVPSGAVRGKVGVLGNGCVVNPITLFEEVDGLRDRGLDPDVRVAERAHVIMPYHRVLDGAEEAVKSETDLDAGTTRRGIGPTYEDKAGRRGIRVVDLLDREHLRERLSYVVPFKRTLAAEVYDIDPDDPHDVLVPDGVDGATAFDEDALFERFAAFGERLAEEERTVACGRFLAERRAAGDQLLFEGAQGTALDIDHGIYPYVTSSNPTAGYAATGTGVGPTTVGRGAVVGVVKAYLSRVGTGPLPTEIDDEVAEYIREEGGEYGTVTGRPRRIGWLDVPMLRHAARTNGLTHLAINHLDVLAGLEEVKVAHEYEFGGERVDDVPASTDRWGEYDPVYRSFDPWPEVDWTGVASEGYEALPGGARRYVEYLADELDATVTAIGVGPDRQQTIVPEDPF